MHRDKITPKLILESYKVVSNLISGTTELSPYCHFNDISKMKEILNIRKVDTLLKVDGSSFSLSTKFEILQRISKLFQGECNVEDFSRTARSFREEWKFFGANALHSNVFSPNTLKLNQSVRPQLKPRVSTCSNSVAEIYRGIQEKKWDKGKPKMSLLP